MASHLLNSYAGVPGLDLIYLIQGGLTMDSVKSTYCETLHINLGSAMLEEVQGHLLFEPTLSSCPITLWAPSRVGSGKKRGGEEGGRGTRGWDRVGTNHCWLQAAASVGVRQPLLVPL